MKQHKPYRLGIKFGANAPLGNGRYGPQAVSAVAVSLGRTGEFSELTESTLKEKYSTPVVIDAIAYETTEDMKAIDQSLYEKYGTAKKHLEALLKITKSKYPDCQIDIHKITSDGYFKFLKDNELSNSQEARLRYIYGDW